MFKQIPTHGRVIALAAGLLALGASTLPAHAATGTSTFTVAITGGPLSITDPASFAGTAVTLNGTARTSTGTIAGIAIVDARGSGAGWGLSMQTADLTSTIAATTRFIAFSGLTMTPVAPSATDGTSTAAGSITVPSAGALSGGDPTPGTTQSSLFTLLTAPANQGMGSYSDSPTFSLAVPASTYAGGNGTTSTYTATVTIQVV